MLVSNCVNRYHIPSNPRPLPIPPRPPMGGWNPLIPCGPPGIPAGLIIPADHRHNHLRDFHHQ